MALKIALLVALFAAVYGEIDEEEWIKFQLSCYCQPELNFPQCASDGSTYLSTCMVDCRQRFLNYHYPGQKVTVEHPGVCGHSVVGWDDEAVDVPKPSAPLSFPVSHGPSELPEELKQFQ